MKLILFITSGLKWVEPRQPAWLQLWVTREFAEKLLVIKVKFGKL